jgi:hypothetical protein
MADRLSVVLPWASFQLLTLLRFFFSSSCYVVSNLKQGSKQASKEKKEAEGELREREREGGFDVQLCYIRFKRACMHVLFFSSLPLPCLYSMYVCM